MCIASQDKGLIVKVQTQHIFVNMHKCMYFVFNPGICLPFMPCLLLQRFPWQTLIMLNAI